jgi:hypothetical protein
LAVPLDVPPPEPPALAVPPDAPPPEPPLWANLLGWVKLAWVCLRGFDVAVWVGPDWLWILG